MLNHTWLHWHSWVVLCACIALGSCGGDDGPVADMPDGGTYCNPAMGGVGTCYCSPSGTQGVRHCILSTSQWGACMCIEHDSGPVCPPGAMRVCTCPDGTDSTQICRASNTADPCMCAGHMLMDSGSSDASSLDSGDIDAS